jgi:hypothetical protein
MHGGDSRPACRAARTESIGQAYDRVLSEVSRERAPVDGRRRRLCGRRAAVAADGLVQLAIVPIVACTTRGLDRGERQWVVGLTVLAVVLRVAVVVALFLSTNHSQVPFGTFFGDESYFIKRSLWLRNVDLGVPVHAIDLEYAFEPNGRSSYVYLLASIQALVGAAPYGLHLVSIAFYVLAILVLCTSSYDARSSARLFGLAVLLFFEPVCLVDRCFEGAAVRAHQRAEPDGGGRPGTRAIARPASARGRWNRRAGCGSGDCAAGGRGVHAGGACRRPGDRVRRRQAQADSGGVDCDAAPGALFSRPVVQLRRMRRFKPRRASTGSRRRVGVTISAADDRFYAELNEASSMKFGETFRYLTRGIVAYLTVPRPWDAQSSAAVAYIPEQLIWYVLAALAALGVLFGFRRDPIVTGLLIAHALLLATASAFTDGNVGTLVRHRGLILPYLAWLSGVGACELIALWRPNQPFSPLMTVLPRRGEMRPA